MEIIFFVIAILLGIILGIFTGLIPSIHTNLISILFLSFYTTFFFEISFQVFSAFIISLTITHTFINFIPTTIFGIPDSSDSLVSYPAHKMTLRGDGFLAIQYSTIGSFFGGIFSLLLSVPLYFFIDYFYNTFNNFIPYVLLSIIIFFIFLEPTISKKIWAIIISLFSCSIGLITLNSNHINQPLLILFSGIFGVSILINSLFENVCGIPKQKIKKHKIKFSALKNSFIGTFTSIFTSITPGIGNAQAGILSSIFFRKKIENRGAKDFITTISSINTSNFIFSIITFYIIEKSRNGSIFVIAQVSQNLTLENIFYYFLLVFFLLFFLYFLTLKIGKYILKKFENVNFKKVNFVILFFIFSLVFFFDGFFGILILIYCGILGLLTITLKIRKIHLMNVLIFPLILSFLF